MKSEHNTAKLFCTNTLTIMSAPLVLAILVLSLTSGCSASSLVVNTYASSNNCQGSFTVSNVPSGFCFTSTPGSFSLSCSGNQFSTNVYNTTDCTGSFTTETQANPGCIALGRNNTAPSMTISCSAGPILTSWVSFVLELFRLIP